MLACHRGEASARGPQDLSEAPQSIGITLGEKGCVHRFGQLVDQPLDISAVAGSPGQAVAQVLRGAERLQRTEDVLHPITVRPGWSGTVVVAGMAIARA